MEQSTEQAATTAGGDDRAQSPEVLRSRRRTATWRRGGLEAADARGSSGRCRLDHPSFVRPVRLGDSALDMSPTSPVRRSGTKSSSARSIAGSPILTRPPDSLTAPLSVVRPSKSTSIRRSPCASPMRRPMTPPRQISNHQSGPDLGRQAVEEYCEETMTSEFDTAASLGSSEIVQRILIGISFDDSFRAREFMTAAQRLASLKQLVLEDAVLIVRDEKGQIRVTETIDPQPGRSALSGAMWASLFGLVLGGPVGWIAGLAAGATAGAVAAKAIDLGISDEWVAWFRGAIEADSATVALLVSEVQEEALLVEARRFTGSHLVYANLNKSMIDRLAQALGDYRGPDVPPAPTDD